MVNKKPIRQDSHKEMPRKHRSHGAFSRFSRAVTGVYNFLNGGSSPGDRVLDFTAYAEQFAKGFEARGVPRDLVGPILQEGLPLVAFDDVKPGMGMKVCLWWLLMMIRLLTSTNFGMVFTIERGLCDGHAWLNRIEK